MSTVIGAECVLHPCGKAWRFVIEEYASIAHSRLTVSVDATVHVDILMLCHWHIHPVIPRRDSYLAAQFIYSVYRTAAVAACYDKFAVNNGDDVFLCLALQLASIYLALLCQLVYQGAGAKSSYHYCAAFSS